MHSCSLCGLTEISPINCRSHVPLQACGVRPYAVSVHSGPHRPSQGASPLDSEGAATILVSIDGSFEWGRRTGQKVSVYVQTPDATVRSNTVTIR